MGTLISLIQGPLTLVEESLLVKDAIRNGQWDIPYFSFEIPTHLLLTFKAIPIRKASTSSDKLSWDGNAKGNFDSNHAYKLAFEEESPHPSFEGKWLWKLNTLPKIQIFLWKCLHNSLPVSAILHHRCMTDNPCCQSCLNIDETCSHVLRDYPIARIF